MLITAFYVVLLILSILSIFLVFNKISNLNAAHFVMLYTLISVECLIYAVYSRVDSLSAALVCNQLNYIDGTFLLMFYLYCVFDICKIKIKTWITVVYSVVNLIFIVLPGTYGVWDGYYKNVELNTNALFPQLIKEYGWAHIIYVVFLLIVSIIPIVVLIYSAFNKKKISYKSVLLLSVAEIVMFALYLCEIFFDFPIEILPVSYVLTEYLLLFIINRSGIFDVNMISLMVSDVSRESAFIVFDNKKCYMGANDAAKYYFPELNELDLDKPVKGGFIKDAFSDWIDDFEFSSNETRVYNRRGKSLLCKIRTHLNPKNKKVYGYVIDIHDDTQQQMFIQMLNAANAKADEAEKRASRANRAKSQFLLDMSQEIKNPITAILGMNEIAIRECEDEKVISYLQDVRNAGENLLFIINDIIDFSRIETGRISVIAENYESTKLFKNVYDLINTRVSEKELDFVVNIDPQVPKMLYGDPNRVRQVMINILGNAVKYTHSGRIALDIKAETTENEKVVNLIISVSDTGIGIKPEDIDKLFESYKRVDEKRNRNIDGAGLGLAMTKRLLNKMGGEISVESVYGEGSTFRVVLPQEIVDDVIIGDVRGRIKERKGGKSNKYKSSIDASGKDILIVDDSKVNLVVAKGLLKSTGANITTVKSGLECLSEISKKHYDIILLDHMMPEMDGIETMQRARAIENDKCKDTKFIALTANTASGMKDLYIEAGFDDYVSKPIDSEELENVLSKYI